MNGLQVASGYCDRGGPSLPHFLLAPALSDMRSLAMLGWGKPFD